MLRPCININPAYASNGLDNGQAGFYQIMPNSSNLAMRVNYSNIGLSGEIRLNNLVNPSKFQGYTSNGWIDLNASIGPTGPSGLDFTGAVNFINAETALDTSNVVTKASIFATTTANVAAGISNIKIRSLASGNYTVNSNLIINSAIITQNSNIITVTNQPIPYKWDFGIGNNSVTYLKNPSGDASFYGWGETSKWVVKSGVNISKGQSVRLSSDVSTGNIVIIPIIYSSLAGISPFTTPFNMLGIALESASGWSNCVVCTKGITTVLCTSNITADFVISSAISAVGIDGIVGRDGGIFCNTTPTPLVNYIRAGYFLESGSGLVTHGSYVLFYVEPKVQLG